MNDQPVNHAFSFKAKILFEKAYRAGKVRNLHQVASAAGISYPTIHAWTRSDSVPTDKVQLSKVFAFLTKGLGITATELNEMKISDLFEFPVPQEAPK